MACYNCTPIPRPGYHAVQAIIHKGIPYCTECGKDVTCELDAEKICGAVPKQAVKADAVFDPVCRKCGDALITDELVCENCRIA